MKHLLYIVVIFLGVTVSAVAQDAGNGKNDGSRIEALKIAYLTKKLNLSTDEAQKFWPIYNKYAEEIRKTRIDARANSESEISMEKKILKVRKKYEPEFNKALSTEKVNNFYRAEKDFGGFLQRELMERRQQNMENRKRIRQ